MPGHPPGGRASARSGLSCGRAHPVTPVRAQSCSLSFVWKSRRTRRRVRGRRHAGGDDRSDDHARDAIRATSAVPGSGGVPRGQHHEGGLRHGWFPGLWLVDRGIGGKAVDDVIVHVDTAVAESAAILLLVGTNDLDDSGVVENPLSRDRTVDEIADLMRKLATAIRERAPHGPLFVQSAMPRQAALAEMIRTLNGHHRRIAHDAEAAYIDQWPGPRRRLATAPARIRARRTAPERRGVRGMGRGTAPHIASLDLTPTRPCSVAPPARAAGIVVASEAVTHRIGTTARSRSTPSPPSRRVRGCPVRPSPQVGRAHRWRPRRRRTEGESNQCTNDHTFAKGKLSGFRDRSPSIRRTPYAANT